MDEDKAAIKWAMDHYGADIDATLPMCPKHPNGCPIPLCEPMTYREWFAQ